MTITRVTEEYLPQAAAVYREAWRESHRDLCTPEFLERRDCGAYLERQMAAGKRLYLLTGEEPVGVISWEIMKLEICMYFPGHRGRGYGTVLLRFAMEQCGSARLTVPRPTPGRWPGMNGTALCRPVKGGSSGTGCGKWNWVLESYHD